MADFEENEKSSFASKYEMGNKLGEGMNAVVYLCYKKQDTDKKAPFAVKVSRADDEERKEAHRKEFEITSSIKHRNIVSSIEMFDDEFKGEIYQIMEFIQGMELLDKIAQQPKGHYTEEHAKMLFK
tara:strand:+ start:652 stop:1029 length:378 start_codon:yes stop_codon:yes gene_type:complete